MWSFPAVSIETHVEGWIPCSPSWLAVVCRGEQLGRDPWRLPETMQVGSPQAAHLISSQPGDKQAIVTIVMTMLSNSDVSRECK